MNQCVLSAVVFRGIKTVNHKLLALNMTGFKRL